MQVPSLDRKDPLEEGMATHSSILTWRIPWTEEPGRLQSMGPHRVWLDWVTNTFSFNRTKACFTIWFAQNVCWPVRMVTISRRKSWHRLLGSHCHWADSGWGMLSQCFQQGQEGWGRPLWGLQTPQHLLLWRASSPRHHHRDEPVWSTNCFYDHLWLYIPCCCRIWQIKGQDWILE